MELNPFTFKSRIAANIAASYNTPNTKKHSVDLPDGIYKGVQNGFGISVEHEGKKFEFQTPLGVTGKDVELQMIVKSNVPNFQFIDENTELIVKGGFTGTVKEFKEGAFKKGVQKVDDGTYEGLQKGNTVTFNKGDEEFQFNNTNKFDDTTEIPVNVIVKGHNIKVEKKR